MRDWRYLEPDDATAAQLLIAVEILASGNGSIGERLHDIYSIMDKLNETDFPEELRDSFLEIKARLETDLRNEQASEVAVRIVRLHDKIVRDYCLPSDYCIPGE
jgi:hypothetical protein